MEEIKSWVEVLKSYVSAFLLGTVIYFSCLVFDEHITNALWPVSPSLAFLRASILTCFAVSVAVKIYWYYWGKKKAEAQSWKELEDTFKTHFPEDWKEQMAEYRQKIKLRE